jgi:hypothetical protein
MNAHSNSILQTGICNINETYYTFRLGNVGVIHLGYIISFIVRLYWFIIYSSGISPTPILIVKTKFV